MSQTFPQAIPQSQNSNLKKDRKKVAIVTGGNRGLGFEACRQLSRMGIEVVLAARDPVKGKQAAERLSVEGLPVRFFQLDVADSTSISRFVREVTDQYGSVDILVNNAGIMIDVERNSENPTDGEEWPLEDATVFKTNRATLRETMEINVYGALELMQKIAPLMKKQGYGRIVNLSSGMGQLSDMEGGWPAYRISKTAINAVTRIFASELDDMDIKVNSVSPGWAKTDMGGEEATLSPEQAVKTVIWLATLPSDGPTGGFYDEDQDLMEW